MKIKFMRSFEFTLDVALIGKIMQFSGVGVIYAALIMIAAGAIDVYAWVTMVVIGCALTLYGCVIEAEDKWGKE